MSANSIEPSFPEFRDAVRRLCADFSDSYWRELDRERGYPTEFVSALTKSGFLGWLIPEEYGGSGLPLAAACAILEEIHAAGCNAAACHAQMYTMGTMLRHGSEAQKQAYLPGIPPESGQAAACLYARGRRQASLSSSGLSFGIRQRRRFRYEEIHRVSKIIVH